MNYTVDWSQDADGELANLWVQNTAERQAITQAAHRIIQELRTDAHRKGTPIDNYRYYRDLPRAVLFEVIPDDGQVWIVEVRLVRP
jgi:hypothetical protein